MIFFFDNSQLVVRNLPDFYLEVYLKLPPLTLQGGCDTPPNPPSSYGPVNDQHASDCGSFIHFGEYNWNKCWDKL